MRVSGGSEFARMQMLQRQAIDTRNKLDTAAKEMATGLKSSRYEATGGNLTRLFALERSLDRNSVFTSNIALTESRLDIMQGALGNILTPTEDVAIDLTTATSIGDYASAKVHATTARAAFADTVGLLNTQVAGQSLFAGTATDAAALAPADAILADLDVIAAGTTTAADAIAAIDAYFAKPGGAFYTNGYIGSTDDLTAVDIGESQRLDYGMRADQDELVAVLRGQALAAVVANGSFAGDQAEQMALMSVAGSSLIDAKEGLLDLRSAVGGLQERVEKAKAQRVAETETLDLARSRMVETDDLEAASNFSALETQLRAMYEITSRLTQLRFFNFMS